MTWFGRAAQALQKYDPSENRDHGKWTSGGNVAGAGKKPGKGKQPDDEPPAPATNTERANAPDGPDDPSHSNIGQAF